MKNIEKYISWVLLVISFLYFTYLAFVSEASWGGADSVVHYRIARYSFKYPHLFLDLWGKPLFTTLSAPFAQLGYGSMKFFNVVVAIITAFFSWKLLNTLKIKYSYLVIPAILFAPIYFIMIPSAMTELLFGLILILSIYFFFKEDYRWSAIIISFLPFARNEGIVLLPTFILVYILKKKIKVIPLILTGFTLLSLFGWKYFGSFFWILKNNPYTGAHSIYGSGSLFHFIERSPGIFGIPLLILFILGFVIACKRLLDKRFKLDIDFFLFWLVIGSSIIYFSAHSYVWWKGMGGSLGLTRVLAGIVPLFAIIGVYAIHFLPLKNIFKTLIAIVSITTIIYIPFTKYDVPLKIDHTEKLIKETSKWLLDEGWVNKLVIYYDPVFCHYLEIDPFDTEKAREQIWNRKNPEEAVPVGAVVIWDTHFGPNEGRMPIGNLLENQAFKMIKHVAPEDNLKVLNGYKYEIYVFERI